MMLIGAGGLGLARCQGKDGEPRSGSGLAA